MLRVLGLTGAVLLSTTTVATAGSAAAPASLEKAFSGTIVSTYPDGRAARYWLNRDGSYTSEGRRHGRYKGKWSVAGNQVCFRRSLGKYCTKIPTGTAFTTKALDGQTVQVRLVPGRAGEKAG
jgi:hypothetical protein